jgi:DNA-binding protein H-NS
MFIEDLNESIEDQDVGTLMDAKEKIESLIAAKAHDEIRAIEQQIAELTIRKDKLIELYGKPKKGKKPRVNSSIVKFRHPATGKTWSGRGKTPQWIVEARQLYSEEQLLAA